MKLFHRQGNRTQDLLNDVFHLLILDVALPAVGKQGWSVDLYKLTPGLEITTILEAAEQSFASVQIIVQTAPIYTGRAFFRNEISKFERLQCMNQKRRTDLFRVAVNFLETEKKLLCRN